MFRTRVWIVSSMQSEKGSTTDYWQLEAVFDNETSADFTAVDLYESKATSQVRIESLVLGMEAGENVPLVKYFPES